MGFDVDFGQDTGAVGQFGVTDRKLSGMARAAGAAYGLSRMTMGAMGGTIGTHFFGTLALAAFSTGALPAAVILGTLTVAGAACCAGMVAEGFQVLRAAYKGTSPVPACQNTSSSLPQTAQTPQAPKP
jgi:hypothetical protein